MNLCVTGGGTGGHLNIAQALAEAAKKKDIFTIFIGSMKGQDRKYFQNSDEFNKSFFLDTTGIVDKKGFAKLDAIKKLFFAFLQARDILKQNNINAVYSVGGFSAAPASFAALSLNIPLYIHEQNAITGKLNKILKPFAKDFISAYDKNSSIKGYPVKDIFFQKQRVRKKIKSVIFLGGSQGARAINNLALELALILKEKNIKIIHQTGENDFNRVKEAYKKLNIDVELYSFTKDLATVISKADLAISRSGASTLWELMANGVVAFFIPYPYAANDHQYFNAKFLVDENLAWLKREYKVNIKNEILNILDEDLEQKSKKIIKLSKKDVALEMINKIIEE